MFSTTPEMYGNLRIAFSCSARSRLLSMIRKSGHRFSEKIMLKSRLRALQEKAICKTPYISGVVENAHCNAYMSEHVDA